MPAPPSPTLPRLQIWRRIWAKTFWFWYDIGDLAKHFEIRARVHVLGA
jgi:hypothetical protein